MVSSLEELKKIEKPHWPFWMMWKKFSCQKFLYTIPTGFDLCFQGCISHACSFPLCFCWGPSNPSAALLLGAVLSPLLVPSVATSSWFLSTCLLPLSHALAQAYVSETKCCHYIRNVTCTVHKWCVGEGTSWGERSDGLCKNRHCGTCQNKLYCWLNN